VQAEVGSLSSGLDVTITYKPVAPESKINTTFDDLVEYRKQSAADSSAPSTGQCSPEPTSSRCSVAFLAGADVVPFPTVRGVDTLITG
jgi:hypothetical protein